jgi:uncharacterized membrane protein
MPATDRLSASTFSTDRLAAALYAAAVISAVSLAIPALNGNPLALDEHVSYFASGASSLTELTSRSLDVMATPPLSHVLERFSLAMLGHSETALRLPSLLCYMLTMGVAFAMGRRVGGPIVGSLTALLLAWLPEALDEVRIARCYGLELLLATAALWSTVCWIDERPRVRRTLIWIVLHAALLWTHYLAAPTIAASLAVCGIRCLSAAADEQRSRLISLLLMAIALGLCAVPLLPPVMRLAEWSSALDYRHERVTWRLLVGPFWLIGAPAAIVTAVLLQAFHRPLASEPGLSTRRLWPLLAIWLIPAAALAAAAFVADNSTLANARYRIAFAPAGAAVLAALLVKLAGRNLAPVLAAAALLAGWVMMPHDPFQAARLGDPSDESWRQAGREVAKDLARDDTTVFTQTGLAESVLIPAYPDDDRFLKYVACRLGAFYTGSEKAVPLPLLWPPGEELESVYRLRLTKPDLKNVVVVGATDTDLNVASLEQFDGLVRASGFEQTSRETRPALSIVRYERGSSR